MNLSLEAKISGVGSYLPPGTLSNADLEKLVDTSDAWILERTGIQRRHVCPPEEATSDLAYRAALIALDRAGLAASDLDAIIVATVTPDQLLPSTACFLQNRLGCRQIMAFDLTAACSGFLYAMTIAHDFIRAGSARHVLIIGAETLTRLVNYEDRQSCILFGDGAGAAVISRTSAEESGSKILSSQMLSSGDFTQMLQIPAKKQLIEMQGREVFKAAVQFLKGTCEEALQKAQLSVDDIDYLFVHQANLRIIEAVAKQLNIPATKIPVNIAEVGNTSSASIPILLSEKIADGSLQRGQTILLAAFGAGLTSGAMVLRY